MHSKFSIIYYSSKYVKLASVFLLLDMSQDKA